MQDPNIAPKLPDPNITDPPFPGLDPAVHRFPAMIDALPVAIYTTDAEGRVTHFNPAAAEFAGRQPELGTDRWCVSLELFHTDGTPMPHDSSPMAIALREGRSLQAESGIAERPDGTRVWFEAFPSPLRDADGRVVGGINMLVDVTARLQAEETRARLSAIVESSDDAIVSKTREGVIKSWNRSAEKLFGYTAEEAVGRHITLIIPEDRLHEEAMIMARLKRGDRIDHFESVRVRKDGSLVDVSLTISPILNSAGRMIGASKTARNITEGKRRQKALEIARAEAEKARAEAEAARDEAQEANRAKSTFLATVSHELRTPLNAIIGYSELLDAEVGGPLSDAQRQQLDRIDASSRHLLDIIEEILTFSRVEAGREEVHIEAVELSELVHSTANLVEPLAAANGLQLQVDCSGGGTLHTDALKVRQILLNLLSNAIKFTNEGEIHLEAGFEGGQAVFRVRDTGIGIEEKDLERIFDAFRQVDQNLNRRAGGTGLGLTVTRQLTDLLNGTTEVESTPGEGSTFTVRLPRQG